MVGRNFGRPARGHFDLGRNNHVIALMLMLLRQVQQLERKPPVTLGLMALMCGLYYQQNITPELFHPYALCPDRVLDRFELMRIVASGLIHADEWHLYHNMISFLWKGYNLEYKLGSVQFLLIVGFLLALSHTLVIAVALILATCFQMPGPLHQCSVGFSSVLFALKVILNHDSPAFSTIYGFCVPTKYAAWLELVAIYLLVPQSSFMGHMCGILAGYICVRFLSMRSTMIVGVRWISRCLQELKKLVTNRRNTGTRRSTPQHAPRRPSAPSYETDEELARRLQEEEYRSHDGPRPQPEQREPYHITPSELRRRRLARFTNGRR
uniref:Peptidase S54 rhomboid domain-containing protein n=1 Tax=Peronospora matthiolae TaxID=2874970 RepID=A0AAV1SY30_9STRA